MKLAKLKDMQAGWFIGNFEPSLHKTNACEFAIKFYKAGASEAKHFHKIATEYTVIIQGKVMMNGSEYKAGDIIIITPGLVTDFVCIEDTITAVAKIPGANDDKYLV